MALLLTKSDVVNVLDMKSTMEIVEKAFAELQKGTANMPARTPIKVEEHHGLALYMPAMIGDMGSLGAKIVTVYPDNPTKYHMPTVLGVIILLDVKTGEPVAIMDGGFLTAMRTGGVSGVATKYMARKDAKIGAILGSGVQAKAQVWAMVEAVDFEKVLVYSIDPPEKIESFCNVQNAQHGVPFEPAESAEAACRATDVLTLATSAAEPIIDYDWLKPGTHINGIGSHAPHMRELDEKTVTNAYIIADQKEACLAESGDFIIPMNEGKWNESMLAGDLGAVVTGAVPGRTSDDQVTLFKSNGLAIQDMSTAFAVYENAKKAGVGQDFSFMD